jgi:hypothetical protein
MTRLVAAAILLGLSMLLSSCGGASGTPEGRLRLEVEQVEMLQLESFPVQFVLHVEGWLPFPCSSPEWEVSDSAAGQVNVALFAVADGRDACIQVLAPFSVNIPLGALPADAPVVLNGEPTGAR